RPTLALEPVELLEALLLESGVAHGEDLVDQQNLRVDLDRGGERKADEHPRGVVLELEVDELLELGERDHLVEAGTRLAPAESQHDRVEDDVVARGEVHVEADAQLDER